MKLCLIYFFVYGFVGLCVLIASVLVSCQFIMVIRPIPFTLWLLKSLVEKNLKSSLLSFLLAFYLIIFIKFSTCFYLVFFINFSTCFCLFSFSFPYYLDLPWTPYFQVVVDNTFSSQKLFVHKLSSCCDCIFKYVLSVNS